MTIASLRSMALFALVVTMAGCSTETNPLALSSAEEKALSAELRQKITRSPHDYFRFVNTRFAKEVCRRFEPVVASMPYVNLHGDAHLEQFAVTPHSAGLADFDDSVTGPPVIDLIRFGVSVDLTARQRGWERARNQALDAFFAAYRRALADTSATPLPAVVSRMRADFPSSRTSFLEWAEGEMVVVSGQAKVEAEKGYARYVGLMRRIHQDWTETFFELKRWGTLEGKGIGSAMTPRYLARIEGPTAADDDDIILEAKEVRDLSTVPCVEAQRGDALRVIAGSVRFGRQPDPFLAIIPRGLDEAPDDPPWWVQSWSPDYTELDIRESLNSEDELVELVAWIGAQMARGHTNLLPPPYDLQQRELVRVTLAAHGPEMRTAIADLSELTIAAHRALSPTD
jgi:hypothetical protein